MNNAVRQAPAPLIAVGLVLIILLTVVIRLGLVDVPLERDEGEYAYGGQLILQGRLPYQQMHSMKLPGIYMVYACMLAMLGQTHQAIHLGLVAVNAATILLVFLLARRLYDPLAGMGAAAFFAVLSLMPSVQGISANAEHFVVLLALGGLYLLLRALEEKQPAILFLSGLLLGFGFLIKQHTAVFILFGGIYILYDLFCRRPVKWPTAIARTGLFILGAGLPYGMTCLFFMYAGSFDKFWFWTFEYARTYSKQMPIQTGWYLFGKNSFAILKSAPLIWLLFFIGVVTLWGQQQPKPRSAFAGMLLAFSFLATSIGFFFRPHYFILLLPASAILAGVSLSAIQMRLLKNHSIAIKYGFMLLMAGIFVFVSLYQHRKLLFQMTPQQVARAIYGLNPFPEAPEVARFVAANTQADDRIAVLGSEPEIYYYSRRRSAANYIYMYPLMEGHRYALEMQREMAEQIESARPKVLIIVNVPTSWLKTGDSHSFIMTWMRKYQAENFTLVGIVDIYQHDSKYHWTPEVNWPPDSADWIAIFKRNNHGP